MREPAKDKMRLEHILGAIDVLLEGRKQFTFEQATASPITYFGFVKHVEIIGEAVYKLTKEFKAAHDEVDWQVIEGMRHVLVHGYYQIKPHELWDTIETDLEPLRPIVQQLRDEME